MDNQFLNVDGVSTLWAKIKSMLNSKVDKVNGKGLSTNDFTNEYKYKVDNLGSGSGTSTNPVIKIDIVASSDSAWNYVLPDDIPSIVQGNLNNIFTGNNIEYRCINTRTGIVVSTPIIAVRIEPREHTRFFVRHYLDNPVISNYPTIIKYDFSEPSILSSVDFENSGHTTEIPGMTFPYNLLGGIGVNSLSSTIFNLENNMEGVQSQLPLYTKSVIIKDKTRLQIEDICAGLSPGVSDFVSVFNGEVEVLAAYESFGEETAKIGNVLFKGSISFSSGTAVATIRRVGHKSPSGAITYSQESKDSCVIAIGEDNSISIRRITPTGMDDNNSFTPTEAVKFTGVLHYAIGSVS